MRYLLPILLLGWPLGAPAGSLLDAVRQAPEVRAAQARSEADRLRAAAAGRWADPQLEGMAAQKDTPDDTMPMWEVSLEQPLPAWGERAARRAQARAAADMQAAEADLQAGELAAEVARLLAEREAHRQLTALRQNQRDRMDRMRAALDSRIGSGQGSMSDLLALQSRLTALDLEVERETRMAEEAEREARQRLGLDEQAPLPAFAAPDRDAIQPEQAPALRLAAAARDEARAMVALARAESRPMTSVSLRFEREEAAMGNEDTLGVALMTDLPWSRRGAARAEQKAAHALQVGRDAEAEAETRRLAADLAKAERWTRLAGQTRHAAAETRARVEQELNARVSAAGTAGMPGGSDLLMLLELWERSTELDAQVIEADLAAQTAQSALWLHTSILQGDHHE